MNEGFLDRTKLNFLPSISSDEPIPDINKIKWELVQLTLSAVNNFRPKAGTPKSQRDPRKPRGLKRQAPEVEDQSIVLFDRNLLLDSDGVGGSTKGVAMFEDLLEAREGDAMLLCIPFVPGTDEGIFEKCQQLCEIHEAVEPRLEALGRAMTIKRERIDGPCQKCWCCRKEDVIPALSHQTLSNLLECRLSDAGPTPSDDLAAFFFKNKAEVWPSSTPDTPDEVLWKTCNCSVLKRIASKILAPEKAIKSRTSPL